MRRFISRFFTILILFIIIGLICSFIAWMIHAFINIVLIGYAGLDETDAVATSFLVFLSL